MTPCPFIGSSFDITENAVGASAVSGRGPEPTAPTLGNH